MRIPELQRPFAWTSVQARELCSDLNRLLEAIKNDRADPQHFFGTLVVLYAAGQPDEIIDGQQRMTTVTLLLSRVEKAFRELGDRCRAIAHVNQSNKSIQDHHNNIANSTNGVAETIKALVWVQDGFGDNGLMKWSPRLRVSPEIRETYLSLISGGDGLIEDEIYKPAEWLREVAQIFDCELIRTEEFESLEPSAQFNFLNQILTVVRDGLVVVRLGTPEAGAGYELFESLNARGVKLNVLDHLKVWMLAEYAERGQSSIELAKVMRELSDDDVEQQVSFFETFFAARTQDNGKYDGVNDPKPLVEKARRLVFRDPQYSEINDSMDLTERIMYEARYMNDLTPIWERLTNRRGDGRRLPDCFANTQDSEWIENRLEMLLGVVLKHQAAYPFLMVAAKYLENDSAKFAELIHSLELFFFRYRSVCGGSERQIVEAYNDFLRDMDAKQRVDLPLIKSRLQELITKHANDETFSDALLEKLDYTKTSARMRTKYFFEMLDNYSYPEKPKKRPGHLDLNQYHLEHIVPQTPVEGDPSLSLEDVNCIGNLCLLPPEINTSLSNLNYREKREKALLMRNDPDVEKQKAISLIDSATIFYHGTGDVWSTADVAERITFLQDRACQIFKLS